MSLDEGSHIVVRIGAATITGSLVGVLNEGESYRLSLDDVHPLVEMEERELTMRAPGLMVDLGGGHVVVVGDDDIVRDGS